MAVYKVPQDVEADDKLIGPFSFRQFIYLIIVAAAGVSAFFLSKIFIPLAIIPAPFIIFFGALALPLRKDQPMETYLAALVSFYLKPRKRIWSADGITSLVEITAPNVTQVQRTKDISHQEAERRLSYLANVVDSRGWSVRGVEGQGPVANTSLNNDIYLEAQTAEDMLDDSAHNARDLTNRIDQSNTKRHQDMLDRMQSSVSSQPPVPSVAPSPVADPYAALPDLPAAPVQQPIADQPEPTVSYNPYPTSMRQTVLQPIDPGQASQTPAPAQPATTKPTDVPITTSEKALSPDIISLANNPDLSVETIAREANRILEKEKLEDEVVISLR